MFNRSDDHGLLAGRFPFSNHTFLFALVLSLIIHLVLLYLYVLDYRFLTQNLKMIKSTPLRVEFIHSYGSNKTQSEKFIGIPVQNHSKNQLPAKTESHKPANPQDEFGGKNLSANGINPTLSELNPGSSSRKRGVFEPLGSINSYSQGSVELQQWYFQKKLEDIQNQLIFDLLAALNLLNVSDTEINCKLGQKMICDLDHQETLKLLSVYQNNILKTNPNINLDIRFNKGIWFIQSNSK